MDEEKNEGPKPEYDIEDVYANNTYYESSVWDLRLIFGQLDQTSGKALINWHTAVTVPWVQAKLLHYFLGLQVAAHEFQHGKIRIPSPIIPADATEPEEDNPFSRALYELVNKRREELLADS